MLKTFKSSGITLSSKFFRPVVNRPGNTTTRQEMVCKSQKLMLDLGIVERAPSGGAFHYLPAGYRALSKLINLIDAEMSGVGAQRLIFSNLCNKNLLAKSNRFELLKDILYTLEDRHGSTLCLAPTHEEPATNLFAERLPYGIELFPLLLYQITNKYRDEQAPKFGLLRSNEFLMKDLYSFHADSECASRTYDLVTAAYSRLFEKLDLNAFRVKASSGAMGGRCSHEFHLENDCGQDEIFYCHSCQIGMSKELIGDPLSTNVVHSECGKDMVRLRTIEAAHTFILGTKYSEDLGAFFTTGENNSKALPLYMASYGVGISRLLAAAIDCCVAKLGESAGLRWPQSISPFQICVIPPKTGSKEDVVSTLALDVAHGLASRIVDDPSDVLFDDRTELTVGRRLKNVQSLGCPFIVVVNKTAVGQSIPKFELINVNQNKTDIVSHAELFELLETYLRENRPKSDTESEPASEVLIERHRSSVTI